MEKGCTSSLLFKKIKDVKSMQHSNQNLKDPTPIEYEIQKK